MNLRSLIIDDEKGARETLTKMLTRYCPDVDICGEADTVNSAVDLILDRKPDLVFLDIHLSLGTAFDILKRIEDVNFEIIFTTAYDRYALNAIKLSAIDYLLKPIGLEDLRQAIIKVKKRREKEGHYETRSLQSIAEEFKEKNAEVKKITLSTFEGLIVVYLQDIIRCEGYKNYTTFYLKTGKKIIVSRTLKEYEELLTEYGFFRIYQSHLVNLNFIKKYNRSKSSTLEMIDGSVLPVSRAKKIALMSQIRQL